VTILSFNLKTRYFKLKMKWVIGVTFGVTYGVILLVTKYVKIIKKKKLEKKRDALIKLLDFIKKLN
jgi:hypothetical protein